MYLRRKIPEMTIYVPISSPGADHAAMRATDPMRELRTSLSKGIEGEKNDYIELHA